MFSFPSRPFLACSALALLGLPRAFAGDPAPDLSARQPYLSEFLADNRGGLEDADGDEVHKRHMAEGLGLQPGASFRTADIFKRHKQVYATFVDKDDKGHYWLKPDFVILERG